MPRHPAQFALLTRAARRATRTVHPRHPRPGTQHRLHSHAGGNEGDQDSSPSPASPRHPVQFAVLTIGGQEGDQDSSPSPPSPKHPLQFAVLTMAARGATRTVHPQHPRPGTQSSWHSTLRRPGEGPGQFTLTTFAQAPSAVALIARAARRATRTVQPHGPCPGTQHSLPSSQGRPGGRPGQFTLTTLAQVPSTVCTLTRAARRATRTVHHHHPRPGTQCSCSHR